MATTGVEPVDPEDHQFKMVKMHAARLGEHFDSVLILVTKHEESGKTLQLAAGVGNFSARYGLAREWILKEESAMKRDRGD